MNEECKCPKHCPYHVELSRIAKRICTCKEESDVPPNNNHTPECYWLDNR